MTSRRKENLPPRSPIRFLIRERPNPSELPSPASSREASKGGPVSITWTMTVPSSSKPRIVIVPRDCPARPCLIALEIISFIANARIVTAREGMTIALGTTSKLMCLSGGFKFVLATPTILNPPDKHISRIQVCIGDTNNFASNVIQTSFTDIFVRQQIMGRGQSLNTIDAFRKNITYFGRFCTPSLQRKNTGHGCKIVLDAVMQFTQQYRFEFQTTSCLFVEAGILDGNSGFVREGNHKLLLLWTEQVSMTTINTNATKNFLFHLQRHTQHRMD